MDSEELSCEERAEIMRKQSRYRELILSGRLILSQKRAAQLLGPDCMYHLYSLNRYRQQETGSPEYSKGLRTRNQRIARRRRPPQP
jgi:hypothetical protein